MTLRKITGFVLWGVLVALAQWAELKADEPKPTLLPAPLDGVVLDPGPLGEKFEVAKVELFGPGEFTVPPNRVVAEDTLVFTLRAKADAGKAEMHKLLATPFPRVRFLKQQDGKSLDADARTRGYTLHHDGRWLAAGRGPDVKTGESLQVWTHLGKGGADALRAASPTTSRVERPKEERKP